MKRIVLIAGGIFFGLIALVVIIGFFLSGDYRVERSIDINKPPSVIYPHVNTLKEWPNWSAWNTDNYPDLTYQYEGPEAGVGAVMSWSDEKAGDGRLEITKSVPAEGVWYTLKFEGFEPSQGALEFTPVDDNTTRVVWYDEGSVGRNPIFKYFALVMDSMVGPDFEEGLQNLKSVAEKEGE